MRVLVLLGSRNHDGQTAKAAPALMEGVANAGGQGELLFLPEMRIERCRQCGADGWGACLAEGACVMGDDLALLVEKMENIDAVVFATPVYFGDLSESMRALLDRLRRTCMHAAGRARINRRIAICVCVAGGGGGGAPNCAVGLEKILLACGFDVIDVVPVDPAKI